MLAGGDSLAELIGVLPSEYANASWQRQLDIYQDTLGITGPGPQNRKLGINCNIMYYLKASPLPPAPLVTS